MRLLLFLFEPSYFLIHLSHGVAQLGVILRLPGGHLHVALAVHAKLNEDYLRKLHNFAEMSFFLILPDDALNLLEAGDKAIHRVDIIYVLIFDSHGVDTLCQSADKSMESPT